MINKNFIIKKKHFNYLVALSKSRIVKTYKKDFLQLKKKREMHI
jgi:hypothetical protein